ncbi:hypothetical protein ATN84_05670 [Paramesorhizobium deserti]|uniref:Uncharacterized protein n=1 Tax=Paramesorhizobium deserti TaxID=1494590 RepID=A0A135I195_9HYPH|nr:hypothetical protein [Paramesorhizobium deserti]KXF79212.1 hypothetical protein ATN84_05670 [Paramesorhizobium deserti]
MDTAAADTSTYIPRAARFAELVACGPATIKLSIIEADAAQPVTGAAIDAVRAIIAQAGGRLAATRHLNAGFAILHQGEEGLWLLLHWWLEGGIATHLLWRSDLEGEPKFAPAEPLLMACVWELGIIDFERRAWMETAMSGKPISDYLTRTMPRGTV